MSVLSFFARGFNSNLWWWLYKNAQNGCRLKREFFTLLYMRQASCNGGYVGRTTKLVDMPNLPHGFHGIHISRNATIGAQCTIHQCVTVGGGKNGAPQIGTNVFIGANAVLIGGIKIGNNVKIGAGAIVVQDIPDNCTVVSEKAKIIRQ